MGHLNRYFDHTPEEARQSDTVAILATLDHLQKRAPEVAKAIEQELSDQRSFLKLIASENFSSLTVQLAMGNLLTDKYAEGFAFHRFYAGCDNVDAMEALAEKTLCSLFGCDSAYVQPHSGADANLVALFAILLHRVQDPFLTKLGAKSPTDLTEEEHEKLRQAMLQQKLLGMSLNSGGHLTHGYRHNISSKLFQASSYDVDPKSELLDYSALANQVKEERPDILLAGYSAYPRRINFAKMREIADLVGATLLVDMAHFAGLVAGKVFTGEENPIPYADIVTSTTHKTMRGPRGGFVLCKKDYEELIHKGCPAVLGGPLPHVIAAKAIAFQEASQEGFCQYAKKIVDNSQALAAAFLKKGARLVTGGTDNHLLILDLTPFGLTGRQGETALRQAHLTVNRNTIPFDKNGPWYTSGIRIGTPAITTLGMGTAEMEQIAEIILDIVTHTRPTTVEKTGKPSLAKAATDEAVLIRAKAKIAELLKTFPLYPEIPA